MKQAKKLTQKLFDGMKPGEIIDACRSLKLNVERLITHGEIPILPLAQHLNIDTRQLSTGAIKYAIIDRLNDTINSPQKAK